jgi:hypothetical protein
MLSSLESILETVLLDEEDFFYGLSLRGGAVVGIVEDR